MAPFIYLASAGAALVAVQCVRRTGLAAAVILLLLPTIFTGRALITGEIFGPVDLAYTQEPLASVAPAARVNHVANPSISDVYSQFLPWNDALRRSVHAGQWPLWNPFELCGTPLAGAAQSAPYHPVTLAGLLVPRADYPAYAASMMLLFAAISAFLLCFELTESRLASLLGAAGWMASTHLVFFAGTALSHATCVLPLVLVGARRIVHEPGRRSVAILSTALVLVVLSGHPETALHVVAFGIAYFLFELYGFLRGGSPIDARQVSRILACGVTAGVVALLLCAVFLLPMAEAIGQTQEYADRVSGFVKPQSASGREMIHRLRTNLFPFIEGAPGQEERHHAAGMEKGWIATAYAGSLLFAPALYGLFRSRRREKWFFAGAVVFGLAAALKAPLLTRLLGLLPGFDVAVNDRMVAFAVIGTAVLAALGIGTWLRYADVRSPASWFMAAAIVILAAATASIGGIAHDYLRIGAARAILPLLLAGAAIMALPKRQAAAIVFALLLLQRGGEASWVQPTISKFAFYPAFPGLEAMRAAAPSRMVATGTMFPPAIATHYGLEDVRGFQAMTFARFRSTYPLWCVPQPVWSNRVDSLTSPFLSLMNVRYAIVPPGMALPPGWQIRRAYPTYAIAENEAALPRAFVPRLVTSVGSSQASLDSVREIRDFAADGVVESEPLHAAVPNGFGTVLVRERGSRLLLHASMQGTGWVIVSNCGWKGWRAREGGKPIHLVPGDHAFLALRLAPGQHDVELFYRPRSFVVGATVSVATLLAILLYTLIPSSAITFFMSAHTSFFAAGFRSR